MSGKRNQNEFAWQNTKKLTTHPNPCLDVFSFLPGKFHSGSVSYSPSTSTTGYRGNLPGNQTKLHFRGKILTGFPLDLEYLGKSWNFFSPESGNPGVFSSFGCRIFITFMPQNTGKLRGILGLCEWGNLGWSLCCTTY